MSRKVVGLLIALSHLTGCAFAPPPADNAVGRRTVGSTNVAFASITELQIAGLADDALGLAQQSRFFEAEARLRRALALAPTNDAVKFDLAVVLLQADQAPEAQRILEELSSRKSADPDISVALADVYNNNGKPLEAIAQLKRVFTTFRAANNLKRAAITARSIANLNFGAGNEAEALCYSFEALTLDPTAEQLGAHALLLVGSNLFAQAASTIERVGQLDRAVYNTPIVKHALALALYGLGDYKNALAAEGDTLDLLNKQPDLGAEAHATWYLIRDKVPTETTSETKDEEEDSDLLEEQRKEVINYRDSKPVAVSFWPAAMYQALAGLEDDEINGDY